MFAASSCRHFESAPYGTLASKRLSDFDQAPHPSDRVAALVRHARSPTIRAVGVAVPRFTSQAALYVVDRELRIVVWNKGSEEMTGIPAAEALGRPCWDVIAGTDERGSIVCHKGCSRGRLLREGHCLPSVVVNVRTPSGRRRLNVETISVREEDGDYFVYILHDVSPTRDIPQVVASAKRVTPRQREILSLLAKGHRCRAIAQQLGVTETTVRNHLQILFRALGVHSQLEAVARARAEGFIEPLV